ncbi:hypothetical protein E4U27_003375 [Claviceps purpurea]|nr:hypothetical protein E4U27_003375 [Claviceps purpurea]KAG6231876.1 hypothetical protein E4U26_006252 [Claviceps purpurea]KAG6308071.1 hypothetical protein E4U45_002584 [Claviceps purpurea]
MAPHENYPEAWTDPACSRLQENAREEAPLSDGLTLECGIETTPLTKAFRYRTIRERPLFSLFLILARPLLSQSTPVDPIRPQSTLSIPPYNC